MNCFEEERCKFEYKVSPNTIKRLYGDLLSKKYTTTPTSETVITKLCLDVDTMMVYYAFGYGGDVYPLSPYLQEGKFVKAVQVEGYKYTYMLLAMV